MNHNVFFELCVESLDAGRAAEAGGADRIELCSQLEVGGVTPSAELVSRNLQTLAIPVHVLVRPRGGDFCYSPQGFNRMCEQIGQARLAGASGIAIGVLHGDRRVDVERTRMLVELARPMDVTFHRAFDETPDLYESLERVISTGADSLLTSGGASDVLSGAESIGNLYRLAGERIQIIAGGGLRLDSLVEVVRRTGVYSLHGSLKRKNGKPDSVSNGNTLEANVREAIRLLHCEYRAALAPTTEAG